MADPAIILKAMAEATRLRILRLIETQELSVGELVEILRMPQPKVSRHLAVLRRAALVADRREGNCIYYRMPTAELDSLARDVWQAVRAHDDGDRRAAGDSLRLQRVLVRRKTRTASYFDAVAEVWDRIKADYIADALPFLIVSNLLRSDSIAVDVGTGTGDVLLALAPKARRVIGIDSSDKMLATCRKRVEQAGLSNVELRAGEAEALPLSDGEADVALASMVLHHLTDPARGIAEMARVVRPGGKVVIIDLVEHAHDWAREVMADVWLGFTEPQVRGWLEQSGLKNVTYSVSSIDSPIADAARQKLQAFVAVGVKSNAS